MALQSKTITGTTNSSVWSWKIVVTEVSADVLTRKSVVTIDEYLGRPSSAGGSYFQGSSTLRFEAAGQVYTKSYSSGSTVNVGAGKWAKLSSHTFEVDNLGTIGNPTTINVGGSMSGANFNPSSANANGTLQLTPLHTAPQVEVTSVTENNAILTGINAKTVVKNLSKKTFNLSYALFNNATVELIKIFDKNGNELVSSNTVINSTNGSISLDLTAQSLASNTIIDNQTSFIIRVIDDKGGRADLITEDYTVIPYALPNLVQTSSFVKRNGQVSGRVVLSLIGTFYNAVIGNKTNNVSLSFKYWQNGTTEPQTYFDIPASAVTINGNNISISKWSMAKNSTLIQNVNKSYAYNFKIKATDSFGKISEIILICTKGEWIMAKFRDRVDFKRITQDGVNVPTVADLDEKTIGEGWENLTPTRGTWTYLQIRKVSDLVEIRGYASSLAASTSAVKVSNIPSQYRPSEQIYAYGYLAGKRMSRWYVRPSDGELGVDWAVNISDGANYTTNAWHSFYIQYLI